jgi:RNA polymerase sigma-70 factor (ECF subfamily)
VRAGKDAQIFILSILSSIIFPKFLIFVCGMENKQKAFSKLIKDNQGLIIKVSRLYTHSLEDQEDLFQEIVLQLWKSYDSFQGNSKISTWMYRVALNTAITLFRKKTRQPQTDELQDFHSKDYLEDNDDKQQQISLLYKVIKLLPDVERAIVMMYLDDEPYKEIAETLGITEVNARVKMNRLKKVLKELMIKHA